MIGYNEDFKLGLSDGKNMGTTLGDAYGLKLGGMEGSDLVFSDGSFGVLNDGNHNGAVFGYIYPLEIVEGTKIGKNMVLWLAEMNIPN